jgi:hypothetical protein
MNLFTLHGKFYENNENRLTSNVLFFLSEFRRALLPPFWANWLSQVPVESCALAKAQIRFQVYDQGKYPDAEIIVGDDTRILVECKIKANVVGREQLQHYAERLMDSRALYPRHHLLVITQTDQRAAVEAYAAQIEQMTGFPAQAITAVQWREVLQAFILAESQAADPVLSRLLTMFLEELQTTMYNRIDIDQLPLFRLNEVVLTSQSDEFFDMALTHRVFWPKSNFSPSQFVGYYFTMPCRSYAGTLSHIARIKHLWHNVTIDEVLTAIPEFKNIPEADKFAAQAATIYGPGDPTQFAIGITDAPILLPRAIPYNSSRDQLIHPNILPGRATTLAKVLSAKSLEDLRL